MEWEHGERVGNGGIRFFCVRKNNKTCVNTRTSWIWWTIVCIGGDGRGGDFIRRHWSCYELRGMNGVVNLARCIWQATTTPLSFFAYCFSILCFRFGFCASWSCVGKICNFGTCDVRYVLWFIEQLFVCVVQRSLYFVLLYVAACVIRWTLIYIQFVLCFDLNQWQTKFIYSFIIFPKSMTFRYNTVNQFNYE